MISRLRNSLLLMLWSLPFMSCLGKEEKKKTPPSLLIYNLLYQKEVFKCYEFLIFFHLVDSLAEESDCQRTMPGMSNKHQQSLPH